MELSFLFSLLPTILLSKPGDPKYRLLFKLVATKRGIININALRSGVGGNRTLVQIEFNNTSTNTTKIFISFEFQSTIKKYYQNALCNRFFLSLPYYYSLKKMEQPKKVLVKKPIDNVVVETPQDTVKKKVMVKVLTPQEKRAELQKVAQFKRDEIVRKKDSIIQRNLNATGLTKEQYQAKQVSDAKKPNCGLDGIQVGKANKRGETKGSCSTGQSNKGESLKDTK